MTTCKKILSWTGFYVLLPLVEAFYRPQGQKNGARIDFLRNGLLRKVVKVLLTAAEQKSVGIYKTQNLD
jgi:hypothetical protein